MWKKTHVGGALGKLSSSWNDGVFLGVRGKSGEYIVGDRSGVWKARRFAEESHWGNVGIQNLSSWPNSFPTRSRTTRMPMVDVPEAVRLRPEEIDDALHDADFKTFPRNYHIKKDDLIKHGYTAKCPGCLAANKANEHKDIRVSAG